jgi:regulatory protein
MHDPGSKPARGPALACLSRRALSQTELQQRLKRKGFSAEHIEDAVTYVKSLGYLRDDWVLETVIATAKREGRGPLWIQQKLFLRGLQVKELPIDENDLIERAKELVTKRFGDRSNIREKQRAMRFLQGRGFSGSAACKIVGAIDIAEDDCV